MLWGAFAGFSMAFGCFSVLSDGFRCFRGLFDGSRMLLAVFGCFPVLGGAFRVLGACFLREQTRQQRQASTSIQSKGLSSRVGRYVYLLVIRCPCMFTFRNEFGSERLLFDYGQIESMTVCVCVCVCVRV